MLKFHFNSEKDLSKYDKKTNSQKKNNSFLLPLSLDINCGKLHYLMLILIIMMEKLDIQFI